MQKLKIAALLGVAVTIGLLGAGCGDKTEDTGTASPAASAPAEAGQAAQQSQSAAQADAAQRSANAGK